MIKRQFTDATKPHSALSAQVHRPLRRLLRSCVGDEPEELLDGQARVVGAAGSAGKGLPSDYEKDREYMMIDLHRRLADRPHRPRLVSRLDSARAHVHALQADTLLPVAAHDLLPRQGPPRRSLAPAHPLVQLGRAPGGHRPVRPPRSRGIPFTVDGDGHLVRDGDRPWGAQEGV